MKYILFDMDGVLVDSEPIYLGRLQEHMRHHGVEYTREQLLRFVGMPSPKAARILVEDNALPMTPEEFWAEENRLFGNLYEVSPELELFDGVRELLTLLGERGVKTALVSSTSSKGILAVLDRFRLMRCFDAIVSREMVENHKPSPEPYETAARYLGAQAGDCVVVEDSGMGIAAGKAAGMTVIAMKASVIKQDTSGADLEVEDHRQLRRLLEERGWL